MAELVQSRNAHDPVANIREWQSRQLAIQPGGHNDETVEHNEVARLCATLLDLFQEVNRAVLTHDGVPKDAQTSLERSRGALVLWSDGYGVAGGHFNDTFTRSRKLRYRVLKTLIHIGNILIERTYYKSSTSS